MVSGLDSRGLIDTNNYVFSPGRFFASQHLKLLLAFILLNYDIQPVDRPEDEWYGSSHMPNMAAGLTIRARQD